MNLGAHLYTVDAPRERIDHDVDAPVETPPQEIQSTEQVSSDILTPTA